MKSIIHVVWPCGFPLPTSSRLLLHALFLAAFITSAMAAEPLTIDQYQLISSKRLTRTDFEYTLRASVINTGPAVKNVTAAISSVPPGTTVIDGTLTFGDVAKGATVSSSDTFIIRRNGTTAFDASKFLWAITSEAIPFGVKILSPKALDLFSSASITVSGTAGPDVAEIGVNGIQGVVAPDGNWSVVSVPLREGNNVLTAVAYDSTDQTATDSIEVTVDATAPRISFTAPADGAFFTEGKVTVTGNINDTVVGTVNGQQATVTVNGVAAAIANRTFSVVDLPLALGPNTITAVGTDRAGNRAQVSITVFYNPVSGDRIELVSGNNQSARITETLTQPLVVKAVRGNGDPVPDKKVIFKVTENDGELSLGGDSGRSLLATTGTDGLAQVQYRLGTRAGAGNNQVSATIVGFEGDAIFSASATPAAPGLLVPDAGNNQIGVVGQPLPKPLVTIVVDSGNNRLYNIPVTFTVKEGGGSFSGQPSVTINSDSDGRSLALFTLGPDAGNDHNIVEANFAGNTGSPVLFAASSRVAGDELETSISGVVLDNSDIPVPGVLMRILGFPDAVRSDEKGHFKIKPAPVGNVRLIADGSTATRPGSWVWLQFDIVTIAGQDNDIGRPVRLVQMDMDHALFVDETHGGILTLPHAPGYSLNIAPGSVTFPNGSKSGHVSVTIVHPDKMPDPPSFGQQPRFLVSIQPANAVFNPPAQMCLPNLDALPPGQKTDMYSYDHDMERFISIGTGTVSEDGTQVCSDPGNGVIKGGWHCGGNPQTVAAGMQSSVSVGSSILAVQVQTSTTVQATGSPEPPHENPFDWVKTFTDASGATIPTDERGDIELTPPPTQGGAQSTATVKGIKGGKVYLKVRYRCKSAQWSDYAYITVNVGEPKLKKLEFVSDHNLLRDGADLLVPGTRFPNVEWDPAATPPVNAPITHTAGDTSGAAVKVKVTLDAGAGASGTTYTLTGTSSEPGLSFSHSGTFGGGSSIDISLTATSPIGKEIRKLSSSITWSLVTGGETRALGSTGPHTIYTILGTPITTAPSSASIPNVARMDLSVPRIAAAIAAAGSVANAYTCYPRIVFNVMSTAGAYSLANESLDDVTAWNFPTLQPRDCITIARFVRNVCLVSGVPGQFESPTFIAHYRTAADPNRPTKALIGSLATATGIIRPGAVGVPLTPALDPTWILGLADSNCLNPLNPAQLPGTVGTGPNGLNAFEAAVVYTDPSAKKWYFPAGTGAKFYDNADSVVQIFQTMIWAGIVDHDSDVETPDQLIVQEVEYDYTTQPNADLCP